MARKWKQVGGDVNPKEYGAVLVRVEGGPFTGRSVEVVRINTDDDRGRGYHVSTADFDESDLEWAGRAHGSKIASSIGASRSEWQAMSLEDKAEAAIGYYGSGWSDETGGLRVEKWSDALPARSNQIEWWR
jgi:hypothetical protein